MVVIVVDMNREAPADASFSSFVVSWKKKIPSLFFPAYHLLLCPPVVLSVWCPPWFGLSEILPHSWGEHQVPGISKTKHIKHKDVRISPVGPHTCSRCTYPAPPPTPQALHPPCLCSPYKVLFFESTLPLLSEHKSRVEQFVLGGGTPLLLT